MGNGNGYKTLIGAMILTILGAYAWATYIVFRVEDKIIGRLDTFEGNVNKSLLEIFKDHARFLDDRRNRK